MNRARVPHRRSLPCCRVHLVVRRDDGRSAWMTVDLPSLSPFPMHPTPRTQLHPPSFMMFPPCCGVGSYEAALRNKQEKERAAEAAVAQATEALDTVTVRFNSIVCFLLLVVVCYLAPLSVRMLLFGLLAGYLLILLACPCWVCSCAMRMFQQRLNAARPNEEAAGYQVRDLDSQVNRLKRDIQQYELLACSQAARGGGGGGLPWRVC